MIFLKLISHKDMPMAKERVIALILIVGLLLLVLAEGLELTISPSRSQCQEGKCLILRDCLTDPGSCFTSHTLIKFLPGDHHAGGITNRYVVVREISNITLQGSTQNHVPTVRIHCSKVGFAFVQVEMLKISGILFLGCGAPLPSQLQTEAMQLKTRTYLVMFNETKIAIFLVNVLNLNMRQMRVNDSDGYGLLALNVFGSSRITSCVFSRNNQRALVYHQNNPLNCRADPTVNTTSCSGGNAVFIFMDTTTDCPTFKPVYKLQIAGSTFSHGVNYDYQDWGPPPDYLSAAGGLSIFSGQSSYTILVSINDSIIDANIGFSGANLFISLHDQYHADCQVIVANSRISNGNAGENFFSKVGFTSGIHIYSGPDTSVTHQPICYDMCSSESNLFDCSKRGCQGKNFKSVWILNCSLFGNAAFWGTVHVEFLLSSVKCITSTVILANCDLYENTGVESIVKATEYRHDGVNEGYSSMELIMSGTEIHHNKLVELGILENKPRTLKDDPVQAVMFVDNIYTVLFENSTISDNTGTGLHMKAGHLVDILGESYITRNSGNLGGGIMISGTILKLYFSACLFVEENQATYGGGIFVATKKSRYKMRKECFFNILTSQITNGTVHAGTQVVLRGNRATVAGNSVYGGDIDKCFVLADITNELDGVAVFYQLFSIPNTTLTEVSSDIRQLCFCVHQVPKCDIQGHEAKAYPGQEFYVSAVAVGQLNGTIPAVALSTLAEGYVGKFESQQAAQQLGTICGDLAYRVSTNESSVLLQLHASYERSLNPSELVTLSVSLTLQECPLGFELQADQGRCDCIIFLSTKGVTCNIDRQSFVRPFLLWIGYQDHPERILVHDTCPLDYCKTKSTEVTLNITDAQCEFDHSGILCGGCKKGLSFVFGSSQCRQCSNGYLAFLLLFLLAGFLLVLVMIYCDLTVSKGTLNGLIFYANIVRVNQSILFPPGQTNIFTVFIAWLNLDLGIELCFYDGMDAYGMTWLQFLFPIYIWVIVGVIIVASWYSSTAARISGSNAIAVLATLFLLSYTKLQRTILAAFSSTFINTHDGDSFPVWLYDGNVPFLGVKHAFLFTAALVAGIGFVVPFTMVVLFGPLLQAKFGYRMLQLRLTPILDAYQGPYKDRFRWWTGIMLLMRSFLLLAFALNILGSPRLNLAIISSTIVVSLGFTWNVGTIYKKFINNVLETFYIGNLGLLATWTAFNQQNSPEHIQNQAVIANLLVGTAFATFLITILYHIILQIKRFMHSRYWCWRKQPEPCNQEEILLQQVDENGSPSQVRSARLPTVSYVELSQLETPCSANDVPVDPTNS